MMIHRQKPACNGFTEKKIPFFLTHWLHPTCSSFPAAAEGFLRPISHISLMSVCLCKGLLSSHTLGTWHCCLCRSDNQQELGLPCGFLVLTNPGAHRCPCPCYRVVAVMAGTWSSPPVTHQLQDNLGCSTSPAADHMQSKNFLLVRG